MVFQPVSIEEVEKQLVPACNPDRASRIEGWDVWEPHPQGGFRLRSYIRRRNATSALSEDVYQDTLLDAFVALETRSFEYRGPHAFAGFLNYIARVHLAQAGHPAAEEALLQEARLYSVPLGPEQALIAQERIDALYQGISQLTPQRQIVVDGLLWDHSHAEIAARHGMRTDQVRQLKKRAFGDLGRLSDFTTFDT